MKPFKTSKEMYTIDVNNDIYFKERFIHHLEIIKEILVDTLKNEQKTAIILGGGSGAGKSEFLYKFIVEVMTLADLKLNIFDPDSIKPKIKDHQEWAHIIRKPDFKEKIDCDNKDDFVHDESSDITSLLIDDAIKHGYSFVYDGTFKNYEKYAGIFKKLNENGYNTLVVLLDVSSDVALDRVRARTIKNDRSVPDEVVFKSNYMVAKTFVELKRNNLMPSYSIFNNNINDVEPKLIAECPKGGEEKIFDELLYEQFKLKAQLY